MSTDVAANGGMRGGDRQNVTPLSPFGAEITEIDARVADEAQLLGVRDALLRYSVIVVRGQRLTPDDQVAFMARLYTLAPPSKLRAFGLDGNSYISIISNIVEDGRPIGLSDAGLLWHTDTCFRSNPELFVSLYAIQLPVRDAVTLGDTVFLSTAAAYDALADDERRRLDGLEIVQSYAFHLDKMRRLGLLTRPPLSEEQRAEVPDARHPLVRVHPITGRRFLYVNESFSARILGMPEWESDQLISRLCLHVSRPEFQFTHNWRQDDFVIWDNSVTQHRATFDYGDMPRRLHRCSTSGPIPVGVTGVARTVLPIDDL